MYELSVTENISIETGNTIAQVTKQNSDNEIMEWLQAQYACELINKKFRHVIYIIRLINQKFYPDWPTLDESMLGQLISEVDILFDHPLYNFKFVRKEDIGYYSIVDLKSAGLNRMMIPIHDIK